MKVILRFLVVVIGAGLSTPSFGGGKSKVLNNEISVVEQREHDLLRQKVIAAHDLRASGRAVGFAVVTSPLALVSKYNLNKLWLVGAGTSVAKYALDQRKFAAVSVSPKEDVLASERVDKPSSLATPTFAESSQSNTLRAQMAWY